MAELEITPAGMQPVKTDFADVAYDTDSGDRHVYLLDSAETSAWDLEWKFLDQADFDVIYGLWQDRKTAESLTWRHPIETVEYTVKFAGKPKIKPLILSGTTCKSRS